MKKERDIMPYGETKVYFDGSHYIAIPHTENPYRKRPQKPEEVITVADDGEKITPVEENSDNSPIETTETQITLEDISEEAQKTQDSHCSILP